MISSVADLISEWLIKKNAIRETEKELYTYAVYSFFISIVPTFLFLLFSGMVGMIREGILIIFPFMVLRKYSGGYHAKYAWLCMILSCVALAGCLYSVRFFPYGREWDVAFLISVLSLAVHSPIDSENRRLDADEVKEYRKDTIFILFASSLIYIICIWKNIETVGVCIAVSIALAALLQVPCIVKECFIKYF